MRDFSLPLFIVDDDPFTGLLYKKFLADLGYRNLHTYTSGVACLNHLQMDPDIVLLDHDMGQVTGFEVLKKIKRYRPDTAVIMVSGQQDLATAVEALKYGAFDYIIKDQTETERIAGALERLERLRSLQPLPAVSRFKKFFTRG